MLKPLMESTNKQKETKSKAPLRYIPFKGHGLAASEKFLKKDTHEFPAETRIFNITNISPKIHPKN